MKKPDPLEQDFVIGLYLSLGDSVRGQLDHGEVALADGAAHLVEADAQRVVLMRRPRRRGRRLTGRLLLP